MAKKKPDREAVQLQDLTVEHVPVGDLQPNDYNPNRQSAHEFDMLKASMREDGFTQPILCMADGTIVDGEHRWRAAQELGYERVPVVRVNMGEAQRRIATMRHNRARGEDDPARVAELMQDLEKIGALDWAQDALQLSDEEVRRLTAMADTVAEDLAQGHEFNLAWEPAERSVYQPPDKAGEPVSYSRPMGSTEVSGNGALSGAQRPAEPAEPMTRRQYVFTLAEAEVVDSVLGEEAAKRLYELCREVQERELAE